MQQLRFSQNSMSLFSGLAELMVQFVVPVLCVKCEIGNDEIPDNDGCFSTTHVFVEG